MNSQHVALAHFLSLPIGALMVAFIFSINLQGPRLLEPWWRGTIRRFLKILGLLLYSGAIVQMMTFAAEARGGLRTFLSGGVIVLIAALFAWMLRPQPHPASVPASAPVGAEAAGAPRGGRR